jgi:putative endopeptidase
MSKIYLLGFCLFSFFFYSSCDYTHKRISDTDFVAFSELDSSIKPGDDFYLFVNEKWIKNTYIPIAQNSVGGFTDLYYQTQDKLHRLLDSVSKNTHTTGTIEQKVSDLYASGMDTLTIEKRGYEPLKPYFAKIAAIKNTSDVMQYVAFLMRQNKNNLFQISQETDDKNSNRFIAIFSQGGLPLPDRDYYFRKDSSSQKILNLFQLYREKLFRLTGDDSVVAAIKATKVFNLETKIASYHKTNVELRDPSSNYHMMAIKDLNKQMPVFEWNSTLNTLEIHSDSVNVRQPKFFVGINNLLKSTDLNSWRDYLQFSTINDYVGLLSNDFIEAVVKYVEGPIYGMKEKAWRWRIVVRGIDKNFGDAIGQIYVKEYFKEDAKAKMLEMVNNLQTAFKKIIDSLDWMSDSTKIRAKEKVTAISKKIGYPDKWRIFNNVVIYKNKLFENIVSCHRNEYSYWNEKIGKPVDRSLWLMTPPTINAYYNPNYNEVVFPAGILQSPFFNVAADDAVNYGAIGTIIGHEMTHGFDDQGAQFDKDGNLKNWWSKKDSFEFVRRTDEVSLFYGKFLAIDSIYVNGALTNGENIADIGGLNIAYNAFKLTAQGRDSVRIDGLLPDERFFISFAKSRRSIFSNESLRTGLRSDTHSPDHFRINGPLENFDPFYTTFHIKAGDKMFRPDSLRVKIW